MAQTYTHGGDRYRFQIKTDFSANINPLGIPDSVKFAVLNSMREWEFYPDIEQTNLKTGLQHLYASFGLYLPKDYYVCGNGASDLIAAYIRTLKPGKTMLFAPGFTEYRRVLELNGSEIEYFYLFEQDKPFENLCEMIEKTRPDLLILTNPNNPDGSILQPWQIKKIANLCKENKIHLLVDECFLWFVQMDGISNFSEFDVKQNPYLAVVNAFTKIYAIPGLRFGYLFTSNQKLLAGIRLNLQPWSVSAPAEAAALACTKETNWIHTSRDFIENERSYLHYMLENLGFKVYESKANYVLFYSSIHRNLKEKLLERQILIRDCSDYQGLTEGYYRAAVRTHKENVQLIKEIKEII